MKRQLTLGVECVSLAGPRADEIITEALSTLTDPAHLFCRISDDQRVRWNRTGDHCASTDHRVVSDFIAADDRRIGTDRGSTPHSRREEFVFSFHFGSGCQDVGEYTARSAKHSVFERDPVIDGDVVLDLDVVADHDIGSRHHSLTQHTVRADSGVAENVREMPDPRAGPDRDVVIDLGQLVDRRPGMLCRGGAR